ncbi:MAG TPA: aminotransferase class IV [Candidatus Thermoplasmatota archaeon]|nr:aminotransferase class IV [Candidatus Thermoplasmatota archaeon]
MKHVFLNGRIVPAAEATVSVQDRGFLYGDGVFETLRAYDGRVPRLAAHLARLHQSCSLTAIPSPDVDWPTVLSELLRLESLREARLRITVTRGVGGGLGPHRDPKPTVLATAAPVPYTEDQYTQGVSAVTTAVRKAPPEVLDPRIKSLNYLPHVLARGEAEREGAFEGLLRGEGEEVVEGSASNLFIVTRGVVRTPPLEAGILPGLTRRDVIAQLEARGVTVREERLYPADLVEAEEIFLTGTVAEILPLTILDGVPVGSGKPGPVTTAALAAYRRALTGSP